MECEGICSNSSEAEMGYGDVLRKVGRLFYIVPHSESFQYVEQVPNYIPEMLPLFAGLILAEYVALVLKGKGPRLLESLNSLSHGIIAEMAKILTLGLQISVYIWIHGNYRLFDLPWNHPITWYAALLGVDLAYYWAHRATHEVNFLWVQHQVHHSSEDFNMTVAVRHPPSHSWINSLFYLPLALVIPPAQCLAHQQLNLVYQAWIHTSLVGKGALGPLEYIFNTPTHHKVHHGCNLYALDKNYGGLLIIWDRIFGTFQEMTEEELVFGIVFQHESHNPVWQMWHKWPLIWEWAMSQDTWTDSFKALCYGPSWIPSVGAPRLGRDEDKIDVKPRPKFNPRRSKWVQAYVLLHFVAVCLVFQEFALRKGGLDELRVIATVAYLLLTLTSIGLLSDGNAWAASFELTRCLGFLTLSFLDGMASPTEAVLLRFYCIPSAIIWAIIIAHRIITGTGVPEVKNNNAPSPKYIGQKVKGH